MLARAEMDFSNITKSKRSAYMIATSILLVSALEVLKGEINVFGLKVAVSQEKVIAILQLFLVIAVFAIIVRSADYVVGLWVQDQHRRLDIAEEKDSAGLEGYYGSSEPIDYDPDSDGVDEVLVDYYVRKEKREKDKVTISTRGSAIGSKLPVCAENLFLAVSISSALFHPTALREYVKWKVTAVEVEKAVTIGENIRATKSQDFITEPLCESFFEY